MSLVKAHRTHGHLAADLDPLGSEPIGDPALDPDRLEPRLTPELQARISARVLRLHVPGENLAEALPHLRETYCGTMAYEIEHISSHEQRVWLRTVIESGEYRKPLSEDQRRTLLRRLTEVEGFERYLRRAFLGQKQFSIEGLDVMVPMLDEALELAGRDGAREVVHRHGAPRAAQRPRAHGREAVRLDPAGVRGGARARGDRRLRPGGRLGRRQVPPRRRRRAEDGERRGRRSTLVANPSHLEYVDPVVEGQTRAVQTNHDSAADTHDPTAALAVLIHGDAAFPGQGVVAETLNLQALEGYTTGGTLHIIANNQVGFTTDPEEGRSTRYSSDLAKGFDVPIIHVNADDAEAAVAAIKLAMAFRERFRHDVVVDLVGYRRFGHNEGDEPAYTQPLMYKAIEEHPSVRELYAARLAELGLVTDEEAAALFEDVQKRMKEAHDALKATFAAGRAKKERRIGRGSDVQIETAVPAERLMELNEELLTVPDGFTVHPKLVKALERRREALGDEGGIDWAQAEVLAFASLLVEGTPIRLTGQDTERGTFSHRHLVLHDYETGAKYTPVEHLGRRQGSVPGVQLAALGDGRGRIRVRVLRRLPACARPLGGAVRRLRQLGPGDRRPVHRLGSLEVGRRALGSRCCCPTATKATGRSTRAPGSSASCSWPRRRTSASSTARPPRSTSTSCDGRRSIRRRGRSSSSLPRACCG